MQGRTEPPGCLVGRLSGVQVGRHVKCEVGQTTYHVNGEEWGWEGETGAMDTVMQKRGRDGVERGAGLGL